MRMAAGAATASLIFGPNKSMITKAPTAATLVPLVILVSNAMSSPKTFLTRPNSDPPHPANAIASLSFTVLCSSRRRRARA
jgi:hypothetical protein